MVVRCMRTIKWHRRPVYMPNVDWNRLVCVHTAIVQRLVVDYRLALYMGIPRFWLRSTPCAWRDGDLLPFELFPSAFYYLQLLPPCRGGSLAYYIAYCFILEPADALASSSCLEVTSSLDGSISGGMLSSPVESRFDPRCVQLHDVLGSNSTTPSRGEASFVLHGNSGAAWVCRGYHLVYPGPALQRSIHCLPIVHFLSFHLMRDWPSSAHLFCALPTKAGNSASRLCESVGSQSSLPVPPPGAPD